MYYAERRYRERYKISGKYTRTKNINIIARCLAEAETGSSIVFEYIFMLLSRTETVSECVTIRAR